MINVGWHFLHWVGSSERGVWRLLYWEPYLYKSNEQLALGWERGLKSILRGESTW